MISTSKVDIDNADCVFDENVKIRNENIKPTLYTFTKIENGKKTVVDSTSIAPPSWLLLDHTIAVVWSMFSLNSYLCHLSIDDLKWAYEFLKEIRNEKGETPPDVKICLKEIQDRLINLYAKLTNLKEEDFDEIAAAFGDSIVENSTNDFSGSQFLPLDEVESQIDTLSLSDTISSSRTTLKIDYPVFQKESTKDLSLSIPKTITFPKQKSVAVDYMAKKFPSGINNSNIFEENENEDNEEVEQMLLSIFDNEKKQNTLPPRTTLKSHIPMKKKNPTAFSISEKSSKGNPFAGNIKAEKTSKKLHCVAEMRSLKFQKSMKVQDINGEEAAYSNLKAEIRRLTINPNVSRSDIKKFLKGWRSEQVDKLHNELKRLNSIEEFIKNVNKDEIESNVENDSSLRINELGTTKSFFSLQKSFLT